MLGSGRKRDDPGNDERNQLDFADKQDNCRFDRNCVREHDELLGSRLRRRHTCHFEREHLAESD